MANNIFLPLLRIMCYYHCDYTEGVSHFRVPFHQGLGILKQLRGHSSGLALPEYMIDLPGGYGKVRVSEGKPTENKWEFTNWEGHKGTPGRR